MRRFFSVILLLCLLLSFGVQGIFASKNLSFDHSRRLSNQNSYSTDAKLKDARFTTDSKLSDIMDKFGESYQIETMSESYIFFFFRDHLKVHTEEYEEKIGCISFPKGELLWEKTVTTYDELIQIYEDSVYVVIDNGILKIDLNTGENRWKFEFDEFDYITCNVVFDNQSIFIAQRNELIELDIPNGKAIRKINLGFEKIPFWDNEHGRHTIVLNDKYLVVYGYGLVCYERDTFELAWKKRPYEHYKRGVNLLCSNWYASIISEDKIIVREEGIRVIENESGRDTYDPSGQYNISDLKTGELLRVMKTDFVTWSNYFAISDYVFLKGLGLFDINTGENLWWDTNRGGYAENVYCFDDIVFSLTEHSHNKENYSFRFDKLSLMDLKTKKMIFAIDLKSASLVEFFTINNEICFRYGSELYIPAAKDISFKLNQKEYLFDQTRSIKIDSEPIIKNGRTLLPARYVTEPLGGQVFWDATERKVTCKLVAPDNHLTEEYKENIIDFWIGKSTAKINGQEVQIDPNNTEVVPTIINDRTMVPMRFLAESLGCEVEWVAETKEIVLTYSP